MASNRGTTNSDTPVAEQRDGSTLEGGVRTTRLLERAIKNGWPIPDELRAEAVERTAKVIRNKRGKHREALSAVKTLVAMDRANIQRDSSEKANEIREYRVININQGGGEGGGPVDGAAPAEPAQLPSPQVVEVTPLRVEYVDDWYGTSTQAAEANASSAERAAGLREIQAAGLRTPLGKDVDGPAGGP